MSEENDPSLHIIPQCADPMHSIGGDRGFCEACADGSTADEVVRRRIRGVDRLLRTALLVTLCTIPHHSTRYLESLSTFLLCGLHSCVVDTGSWDCAL